MCMMYPIAHIKQQFQCYCAPRSTQERASERRRASEKAAARICCFGTKEEQQNEAKQKNVHTEKRTKIKQSKIMARVHLKESEQYIQQYAQNYVRQTIIKQQRLNMKKKKKQAKWFRNFEAPSLISAFFLSFLSLSLLSLCPPLCHSNSVHSVLRS